MPRAQQLGRYHLLDRLAYGGMAEIFRARTYDDGCALRSRGDSSAAAGESPALGSDGRAQVRLVAIKRILPHLAESEEVLQMLVDEAKVTATLRHENIAQLYEFAHAGREYFLAMEYVDGKDVRAIIDKARQSRSRVPVEHAAWMMMETAIGLHAAHCQKDAAGSPLRIVHRDVSPSNILCSYLGEVKLCDFGIAKATLTRIHTRTGIIKGKVKYMSPEQAMGRPLDHRSDLFSLGTVLYELLALHVPFTAATEVELIFTVREARKRPIGEHRPDVPAELAAILDRAMTRARNHRYQSGDEMARDLRRFLDVYQPGYRRGHFAQYMRDTFAVEIEGELRQLETYVLEEPDAGSLGENLIADVLGPGAPFTHFSPAPASPTVILSIPASPPAVHGEPTRLVNHPGPHSDAAARPSLGADMHEAQTQLRPSPYSLSLEQEETRLHALTPQVRAHLERQPTPARVRSIFDEKTDRKVILDERDLETDLHRESTQIFQLAAPLATPSERTDTDTDTDTIRQPATPPRAFTPLDDSSSQTTDEHPAGPRNEGDFDEI